MTASQRFNDAKKHGRGLRYSITVYVPLTSGRDSEFKKEHNSYIAGALRKRFECFKQEIKELHGVVRISLDK